jgi:signal transduction histidine kinase
LAVNLEDVLESVLNLYTKQIEARQITLTKQYLLVDGTIRGHPADIRQVFSTLLVNAMEAIPEGGRIGLRASKSSHWKNPDLHGVRVTIADNGVGIPAHNASRIFEHFLRPKESKELGLASGSATVL